MLTRRDVLSLGAAAGLSALVPAFPMPARAETGLRQRAAARGIVFGSMTNAKQIEWPELRQALVRDCAITVPENEMKWGVTQPTPAAPNYAPADRVAAFARQNGLALRGHTAVWYRNLPGWAAEAIAGPDGRRVFEERVRGVVGHFKGQIAEWDVVNEEIEVKDGRDDHRRASPFLKAFGPDYIADAFRLAHEADPEAKLFYNDYGIEYDHRGMNERRAGVLKLLTDLKTAGAPIHGFGIQSHLVSALRFDPALFRAFLAEVADLGLTISLTELDVNDYAFPEAVAIRDQAVADHLKLYLDTALDEKAVRTVVTWGFTDRDTWLNSFSARKDKAPQRPLPLDADLRPKPMWTALAQAFDHAPQRA